jgi:coenzyme PQQ precursor peptide PqqA
MEIQMTNATALEPSARRQLPSPNSEKTTIKWASPRIVEIAVGLEINSYARAEPN